MIILDETSSAEAAIDLAWLGTTCRSFRSNEWGFGGEAMGRQLFLSNVSPV
jgi:hypothetical protein